VVVKLVLSGDVAAVDRLVQSHPVPISSNGHFSRMPYRGPNVAP
jgi:hypothetical protein